MYVLRNVFTITVIHLKKKYTSTENANTEIYFLYEEMVSMTFICTMNIKSSWCIIHLMKVSDFRLCLTQDTNKQQLWLAPQN